MDPETHPLVVVDVQQGFDEPWWGPRNNLRCDENIEHLVTHWTAHGGRIVLVQHSSADPGSPLHPDSPGHRLKTYLTEVEPALEVTKTVNSSFHGSPDLDAWLKKTGAEGLVICGITTNHCCETTARVGGNLGHDVWFALDATHTFDRRTPDGSVVTADELARATAANLHGEFATVVTTDDLVD